MISSQKLNYDFIFDYSSYKKIYKFKNEKGNEINYFLFENPINKREFFNKNEFNLIFNEDKISNLRIRGSSLNLILEIPSISKNLTVNLNLKPSFVKIVLPKNSYIEIKMLTKNSYFELEEIGFKKKSDIEYYYDNGENKIFFEINASNSYIDFSFLD